VITRDAAHRYTYEGVQYPGVTTILSVLDKPALINWAAKETATAAARLLPELPKMMETLGETGVIAALSNRQNWTKNVGAQLGTEVHALADLVVRGEPTPSMTDTQRVRVLHYAKWWKESGWKLRLSEAMVVQPYPGDGPSSGFGGTFDLLAYDRDGKTVLGDVKTGKGVYREAVLQLAAYGMATIVQPALTDGVDWVTAQMANPALQPKIYPMPLPDRYVILHVTADGVREIEVAVGTAERMAFLACLDLWHWTETMKGKRL
jgi:hypothetical protein